MSRRRHRGLTLFIMLLALIFLSLFLVVAARLFGSVTRTAHSAHEAEREMAGFESAVRALRRDAWAAQTLAPAADASGLSIESSNGSRVRWQSDDTGSLLRSVVTDAEEEQVQRWPQLGGRLRFATKGPALVVSVLDAGGSVEPGELQFVSQVLLAREARQ